MDFPCGIFVFKPMSYCNKSWNVSTAYIGMLQNVRAI